MDEVVEDSEVESSVADDPQSPSQSVFRGLQMLVHHDSDETVDEPQAVASLSLRQCVKDYYSPVIPVLLKNFAKRPRGEEVQQTEKSCVKGTGTCVPPSDGNRDEKSYHHDHVGDDCSDVSSVIIQARDITIDRKPKLKNEEFITTSDSGRTTDFFSRAGKDHQMALIDHGNGIGGNQPNMDSIKEAMPSTQHSFLRSIRKSPSRPSQSQGVKKKVRFESPVLQEDQDRQDFSDDLSATSGMDKMVESSHVGSPSQQVLCVPTSVNHKMTADELPLPVRRSRRKTKDVGKAITNMQKEKLYFKGVGDTISKAQLQEEHGRDMQTLNKLEKQQSKAEETLYENKSASAKKMLQAIQSLLQELSSQYSVEKKSIEVAIETCHRSDKNVLRFRAQLLSERQKRLLGILQTQEKLTETFKEKEQQNEATDSDGLEEMMPSYDSACSDDTSVPPTPTSDVSDIISIHESLDEGSKSDVGVKKKKRKRRGHPRWTRTPTSRGRRPWAAPKSASTWQPQRQCSANDVFSGSVINPSDTSTTEISEHSVKRDWSEVSPIQEEAFSTKRTTGSIMKRRDKHDSQNESQSQQIAARVKLPQSVWERIILGDKQQLAALYEIPGVAMHCPEHVILENADNPELAFRLSEFPVEGPAVPSTMFSKTASDYQNLIVTSQIQGKAESQIIIIGSEVTLPNSSPVNSQCKEGEMFNLQPPTYVTLNIASPLCTAVDDTKSSPSQSDEGEELSKMSEVSHKSNMSNRQNRKKVGPLSPSFSDSTTDTVLQNAHKLRGAADIANVFKEARRQAMKKKKALQKNSTHTTKLSKTKVRPKGLNSTFIPPRQKYSGEGVVSVLLPLPPYPSQKASCNSFSVA